jgi:hypothetical protein
MSGQGALAQAAAIAAARVMAGLDAVPLSATYANKC